MKNSCNKMEHKIETKPKKIDEKFQEFIASLLRRGKKVQDGVEKQCLSNKTIKKYTTEYLDMFELAFTHSSYDKEKNYELLELEGDTVVNYTILKYLRLWNPNIVSVKYLTRLKHNICSKKELGLMAEKAGFYPFIKMSSELREKFDSMSEKERHQLPHKKFYKDSNGKKQVWYISMMEDTFEAFMGALSQVADMEIKIPGAGVPVAFMIMKSFLDEIKISINYEDVFDAKTRYKEMCDARKWDFGSVFKKQVYDKTKVKVTVYGYPYGDKTRCEQNKCLLATMEMIGEMECENAAAQLAINVLKNKHNIYDIPPNPYKKKN